MGHLHLFSGVGRRWGKNLEDRLTATLGFVLRESPRLRLGFLEFLGIKFSETDQFEVRAQESGHRARPDLVLAGGQTKDSPTWVVWVEGKFDSTPSEGQLERHEEAARAAGLLSKTTFLLLAKERPTFELREWKYMSWKDVRNLVGKARSNASRGSELLLLDGLEDLLDEVGVSNRNLNPEMWREYPGRPAADTAFQQEFDREALAFVSTVKNKLKDLVRNDEEPYSMISGSSIRASDFMPRQLTSLGRGWKVECRPIGPLGKTSRITLYLHPSSSLMDIEVRWDFLEAHEAVAAQLANIRQQQSLRRIGWFKDDLRAINRLDPDDMIADADAWRRLRWARAKKKTRISFVARLDANHVLATPSPHQTIADTIGLVLTAIAAGSDPATEQPGAD